MERSSCADVEAALTPFIDGEVSLDQRDAIAQHLARCPGCRDRAAAERIGREIVRTRASALRVEAPADLRARCARAAGPDARRRGVRRWMPLSIAATLLLVAGGLFLNGMSTRLEAALAAQLTLDHVKCFILGPPSGAPDAQRSEADWLRRHGWALRVPPGSPAHRLELLGVRRCLYMDGTMAHVMYRDEGRPLSLYVLPRAGYGSQLVATVGHEAKIWSANGRTYGLVGDTAERLETLAAYMQSVAE
jgi:anti-sigma factor (TIGR02949 family)